MATIVSTYNGTVRNPRASSYGATAAKESHEKTFSKVIASTDPPGSVREIPSTPHTPLTMTGAGVVTEMVTRATDGSYVRGEFSANNTFVFDDLLDISATDDGVGGGFAHNVTIKLTKGGADFLSVILQTNVWAQDYVVVIKTQP